MTAVPNAVVRAGSSPVMVIAAGSIVLLLIFGTRQSFGLFLQPVTAAHGWNREVFAFAIAIQMLLWGVMQPLAGAAADKLGSGRVVALAGLCFAGGLVVMGQATTPLVFDVGAGILIGTGIAGAGFGVIFAAMARVVPANQRSLAFGIGTAVGSFGQFIMVPVSLQLINWLGWSGALLALAAITALSVPLAAGLRGRSEAISGGQSLTEALREARGHSGYLLLATGYFVCGFHVTFIATHLPAYLVDRGVAADVGAWALALIGLFNVGGSIAAGYLGQRQRKKYLLSGIYFFRSLVILAFVLAPVSPTSALVFASAIGVLWLSTVPLTTGLVGQIFGIRYLGTLTGVVFLSHQMGAVTGVWLGGKLYDATGSYDVVWWIAIVLGFTAAALHYPINDRPLVRPAMA
jgi:MFS family permease